MRDFVAFVLLMAFLFVFFASLIALFRPLPKLKLGTRKAALLGLAASFGLFVLVALVIPPPDPASEKAAVSAPEKVAPKADPEQAKADTIAFYRAVMNTIKPCDLAAGRMAEAASATDLVGVYRAATAMENACLSTASDIRDIDVPKSIGKEGREKLEETQEICARTYSQRWASAGKVKDALDSDGSIKSRAALQESAELQQTGMMLCAAGLMGAAMAQGATDADLK